MIKVISTGGRIGPLCWSNTLPPVLLKDRTFAGMTTCLRQWGRTYWCPPGEPWTGLHYSCEESFQ
jgi:hypothetical protein